MSQPATPTPCPTCNTQPRVRRAESPLVLAYGYGRFTGELRQDPKPIVITLYGEAAARFEAWRAKAGGE